MHLILFDGDRRNALLPLTYTRPVADIRIGILTIREKWEHHLKLKASFRTEGYLEEKFPLKTGADNLWIQASVLPSAELLEQIQALQTGEALWKEEILIACRTSDTSSFEQPASLQPKVFSGELLQVCNTWDIFSLNDTVIKADFELLCEGRKSAPISATNRVLHPERIFIEPGASVEFSMLNASEGPIYIGREALVMEGCMIRGSFALCDHGVVKMGAKIYGGTTIGPYGKAGGEINNSVIFGYSSKGHDGFLGNSVLGEWCNLGADTNNSNLKNNYAKVRLWNYESGRFDPTGLQFCGLIMGDHSKTAINTMFNTGTVIGVNSNIYATGFPRNFVPSFSWGKGNSFATYPLQKAFEAAQVVMSRRGISFTEADARLLESIYKQSEKYRSS
ncbi:GlmU family protein [Robiginitalea sp. IMCC43444]|uniref:GlmU family protein n=1 Tax=Robiginitalea sp. IMCC43444 TaxID=3459121 RepID=UPI00404344C8